MLTYQVGVMETSGAPITNSVYAEWTSLCRLNHGRAYRRRLPECDRAKQLLLRSGNYLRHLARSDRPRQIGDLRLLECSTGTGTDSTVRIGDTVVYSLALTLREGMTQNVVVTDQLPTGLAFDSVVSINPCVGQQQLHLHGGLPTSGGSHRHADLEPGQHHQRRQTTTLPTIPWSSSIAHAW